MPFEELQSLDECLQLDDFGQNRAIYCIMKELEAGRATDQATVRELQRIGEAVERLTSTDLKAGIKWNILQYAGALFLGLVFSVVGGMAVWFLQGK